LKIRKNWFEKLNNEFGNGIFLLNIYELEALMLADIQTFNLHYKSKINFNGNPMMQEKPKEFLMAKTEYCQKKYVVSHAPNVFEKLDFETVYKNCSYFKAFIKEFEQLVA
jgi:hypothetical protein